MNDEKLIASGILDILAVKNHELAQIKFLEAEKALVEARKIRDRNIVMLYLRKKFPLATAEEIPEISEKEFPLILKRARNYYLAKLGMAGIATLPFIGGSIAGWMAIEKGLALAPNISGFFVCVGGIVMTAAFSFLSAIPIRKVWKYLKLLTRG